MSFTSHAHFWTNPAHFRSFLRRTTSSTSPIDLFSNKFLLKHSKVSHSSNFLSSVARKGGSIYLTSVYFLVLGVAKRGVPVQSWIPLWIHHCIEHGWKKIYTTSWIKDTLSRTSIKGENLENEGQEREDGDIDLNYELINVI